MLDGGANATRAVSNGLDAAVDRPIVDGFFNWVAKAAYTVGLLLRNVQVGMVRYYVVFIALASVALFVLASMFRALAH
jgi:hypothetical protein